jgi:SAM-dependent methyltransferase
MQSGDRAEREYRRRRVAHWDALAQRVDAGRGWGGYYHARLARLYRMQVSPGQRVLEIGCARGDLLAALEPDEGVGVDFSAEMIARARRAHPHLTFIEADAHAIPLAGPFDVIVLSDLVNDAWDVQQIFSEVRRLSGPATRILMNVYSRVWEMPLAVAGSLGVARPNLPQNWLTVEDLRHLCELTGLEVVRRCEEFLLPLPVPLLAPFANRFLVRLWPFRLFALTNVVVARPAPRPRPENPPLRVSVVVPARNEADNIAEIFDRVPRIGGGTELVFVEGHSKDATYDTIAAEIARRPAMSCQLHRQVGVGKGDAVRLGFERSTGDVFMILDADLTVPPEDLPRFYDALVEGKGDFVNGVRLVYPMEERAMRFLNLLGNKFFSLAFSRVLGQPVKDTLCGTKVLRRADYERIVANRATFGDFDPFGDFDLLFGAARLNLKIVDLPIRYRERRHGTTNIDRWRHGALLFRMLGFAAIRLWMI